MTSPTPTGSSLLARPLLGTPGDRTRADLDVGFTLVLASLTMYLEHGIEGELVYDKLPDAEYADR